MSQTLDEFLSEYTSKDVDHTVMPKRPMDFQASYLPAPVSPVERYRTRSLWKYDIDRKLASRFDSIVTLASKLFDTESVLISFIDDQNMLMYNAVGFEIGTADRDVSFCGHGVLGKSCMVVPDASKDWRFAGNPYVTKNNGIRFYAGSPIVASGTTPEDAKDDHAIGMMCIIDSHPKPNLTQQQRDTLEMLSSLVRDELDLWFAGKQIEMHCRMSMSLSRFTQYNGDNLIQTACREIMETLNVRRCECVYSVDNTIRISNVVVPVTASGMWISESLTQTAIYAPVHATSMYIVAYTDDKQHVLDQYNINYLKQFAQAITVRMQQRLVEEANNAKSIFIKGVSHEIRTPLNGILAVAELLNDDNDMSPQCKGMVSMIQSSGKNLIGVINGLLDFNYYEQDTITVRCDEFNIAENSQAFVDAVSLSLHGSTRLMLDVEINNNAKIVMVDTQLVRQVVLNILSNAVKFTTDGYIHLKVELYENVLTYIVSDTGCGISDTFIPFLFQPFKKQDQFTQGVGLGLAISRLICEKLGGSVELVSTSSDGTTMKVCIPVTPVATPEPAWYYSNTRWRCNVDITNTVARDNVLRVFKRCNIDAKDGSHVIHIVEYGDQLPVSPYCIMLVRPEEAALVSDTSATICTLPLGPQKLANVVMALDDVVKRETEILIKKRTLIDKNIKVLIVDDNNVNRNLLAMFCNKRKMKFTLANDGLQAIDAYVHDPTYDLVLMDWQMPKCDGVTAIRSIRKYEKENAIKPAIVIMLTGLSEDYIREECYTSGADGYYIKPISIKDIDALIESKFI